MPRNKKIADLYALRDGFEWIVEDPANLERIVDDTHAAYAAEIEALKAEIAPDGDASRVSLLVLDGELWARTAIGREPGRAP